MTIIDTTDTAADIAARMDGPTVAARQARPIAGRAGGITLDALPGRDLDPDELVELASSVAADPSALAPHIAFSDEKRHYVSLYRDGTSTCGCCAGPRRTTPAGTTTTSPPARWPSCRGR